MSEPVSIRIRSDWDAALTYDSLDEDQPISGPPSEEEVAKSRSVFVGRESIIAPLVAEIIEPNKRGTYLISGYRGIGKTSLIIEAFGRAKDQLKNKGHKLFPLVLNVSEVSASLGTTSLATPNQLDIDPRRLLIALLRTIDHRITRFADTDSTLKSLAEKSHYAYEKATAAKFARTSKVARETARLQSREFILNLENKNLLRTLAMIMGATALVLEAIAWDWRGKGWLNVVAAGLGVVATISLVVSYKRSKTEKLTSANQTAFEHDNSLHQLETDLKDILQSLKQNKLRTVVVMEELDKIDDPEGKQLAAVIRYFKNLFTQAPALFFFVTDKTYFDTIATAIKRARRQRSYAVEHTFFTHRLFVGRPTTDESLDFIARIAADEAGSLAIRAVGNTLGKPSRIDDVDQLGRFVRVVLFNAANHLFDLKNELRRFARNQEEESHGDAPRELSKNGEKNNGGEKGFRTTTEFLIDDQTLPPEEAALAVFQDLIVEKSRSFEIKGGRTYANETLADSLYAVFNELGSNEEQRIESFLPLRNPDSDKGLLLDEQLDLNDIARIRDAVYSLISDLERGRALSRDTTGNNFIWFSDAARAFRYVRQLEKHEESLIAELQRHATLAAALNAGKEPQHPFAVELEQRAGEVRDAHEPLPADAAAAELRQVLDRYAAAMTQAFDFRLEQLKAYGFFFEPVARGLSGSLYLVKPKSGDPRLATSAPRGGVLLAFGETETMLDDVWSFITPQTTTGSLSPLDRVALVHVIHTAGSTATAIETRREQWLMTLQERTPEQPKLQFAVDVIALIEPTSPDPEIVSEVDEIQRTAASLAAYGAWVRPEKRPYESIPAETPPLQDSLTEWLSSDSPYFHISTAANTERWRPFQERDVIERNGTLVLGMAVPGSSGDLLGSVAIEPMLTGFEQASGGPSVWRPLGRWLLLSHRVVLSVIWSEVVAEEAKQELIATMGDGAKVIVEAPGPLPSELFSFVRNKRPGSSDGADAV